MHLISRRSVRTVGLSLAIVPFLSVSTALAGGQKGRVGVDADAIVRRMLRAYQTAQSIQEVAEAKVTLFPNPEYIQTTAVKFKRPNLLLQTTQDPHGGTVDVYCNGKTLTVYSGKQNIFTKRTAPGSVPQTLNAMTLASKDLTGSDNTPILSPFSFLRAGKHLDEVKSMRFVREETLDGRRVYVLTGTADNDWLNALLPAKNLQWQQRDISLWIDAETSLLRKSRCRLIGRMSVVRNGKQSYSSFGLGFEEVHRDTVLNVPLRDEDFIFRQPKNAAEQFKSTR